MPQQVGGPENCLQDIGGRSGGQNLNPQGMKSGITNNSSRKGPYASQGE